MLKNTRINLAAIRKIARALGEMNEQVVYVGGAVVSLYINDPAADDVRPTKDVDISMAIATWSELETVREELTHKGFIQSAEDDVICRFRYKDIKVDVMNTKAIGWAPSNPWFAPGFEKKEFFEIEEQRIQILSLPYFLASKFAAFNDRGAKDPRTSHDFEDIIYILDNRTDIVEKLNATTGNVRSYLREQFQSILDDPGKLEAITGNLFYETRQERFERILNCIHKIIIDI